MVQSPISLGLAFSPHVLGGGREEQLGVAKRKMIVISNTIRIDIQGESTSMRKVYVFWLCGQQPNHLAVSYRSNLQ